MGGGGGLGLFKGTAGASGGTDPFSGGTLVAAAANVGTVTDAGGTFGSTNAELTFGQAVTSAFGNILPSAGAFANDLKEAALSPWQTIKGLSNIVAGYACQATGVQSELREYSAAVTTYFSNRYGSMANIKQTLATDPVGLAADMSFFLTGGSGALRSAAKAASVAAKVAPVGKAAQGTAKAADVLGKTGAAMGKVGNAVDPLTGVQAGIKASAPRMLKKLSPATQESIKKTAIGAARSKTALVPCTIQSVGYSFLSLILASGVLNCQLIFISRLFRVACHAQTSDFINSMSAIRRFRH